MNTYNWDAVPVERMNALVTRQVIHGSTITIARIGLSKGAVVPLHSHINEQISMIESGRLRFVMEGKDAAFGAGSCVVIPPGVPHMVEALEDSMATDVFSPIREDWIRGDDAYLRQK